VPNQVDGVIEMKEKYFYIEPEKARELLSGVKEMKSSKRGIDRYAYLVDDYVVLPTNRIKLRNVTTRDRDLSYFDELIQTLMSLRQQGIMVVPVLFILSSKFLLSLVNYHIINPKKQ